MSGTSCDGIDAALIKVSGTYTSIKVEELAFISIEYEEIVRQRLLELIKGNVGGSQELSKMSFLLGHLFTNAAKMVCDKANIAYDKIDLIGSHGHTFFHIPQSVNYLGYDISATMQLGEVCFLSEFFKVPVVSDFRTRDFGAGGMGAPLVPYSEFILFRSETEDVAYQNIGGIGNVTILRKSCSMEDVVAFDTGPGNALLDALAEHYLNKHYDEGGVLSDEGKLNEVLKSFFLKDEYLMKKAPKSTGREYYNSDYVNKIIEIANENNIDYKDVFATTAYFTAYSISSSLQNIKILDLKKLIVSGGGAHNRGILKYLKELMPKTTILTGADYGINVESKEAVAFAILANETYYNTPSSVARVTGAKGARVLGKIQY